MTTKPSPKWYISQGILRILPTWAHPSGHVPVRWSAERDQWEFRCRSCGRLISTLDPEYPSRNPGYPTHALGYRPTSAPHDCTRITPPGTQLLHRGHKP